MEPDAQADRTFGVRSKLRADSPLDCLGTLDGATGAWERNHEAVTLRLHLKTAICLHLFAHDGVVGTDSLQPPNVPVALVDLRRGLDVREEQRDCAIRRRGGTEA